MRLLISVSRGLKLTLLIVNLSSASAPTLECAQAFLDQGEYEQAKASYQQLARQGNLEACYRLGQYYEGIEANDDKARQFFQQAADGGHGGAQSEVVYLFEKIDQVQQANHYRALATAQGYEDHHFETDDEYNMDRAVRAQEAVQRYQNPSSELD